MPEADATSATRSSLAPQTAPEEDVHVEIKELENDNISGQTDKGHGNSSSRSVHKNKNIMKVTLNILFGHGGGCVSNHRESDQLLAPKDEKSMEMQQVPSNSLRNDVEIDFWKQDAAKKTHYERSDQEKRIFKFGQKKPGVGVKFVSIGLHNRGHDLKMLSRGESCKRRFYTYLQLNKGMEVKCKSEILAMKDMLKYYYVDYETDKADDKLSISKGRDDENKHVIEKMGDDELFESSFNDACFLLAYFGLFAWDNISAEVNSAAGAGICNSGSEEELQELIPSKDRDHYSRNIPFLDVMHDICLMENQLPIIVLETIYNALTDGQDQPTFLRRQIVKVLNEALLGSYPTAHKPDSPIIKDFHHMVHYFHMYFMPPHFGWTWIDEDDRSTETIFQWHKATDLNNVGITLKSIGTKKSRSLLDITFQNGVLSIPTLTVNRDTSILFQNILSFEHELVRSDSSNWYNNYFIVYIKFMAELMTSPADVRILIRRSIIYNRLGTEKDVVKIFAKFNKRIKFDKWDSTYLTNTLCDLDDFYDYRSKKWKKLMEIFFKTKWIISGLVGGTIVTICTVIQAVYAVKGNK